MPVSKNHRNKLRIALDKLLDINIAELTPTWQEMLDTAIEMLQELEFRWERSTRKTPNKPARKNNTPPLYIKEMEGAGSGTELKGIYHKWLRQYHSDIVGGNDETTRHIIDSYREIRTARHW